MNTPTLIARSPVPLPEALAQLASALKVEQRRQAAACCVADHLCFVIALSQGDKLTDEVLLERSAAIVAAVLGLTKG